MKKMNRLFYLFGGLLLLGGIMKIFRVPGGMVLIFLMLCGLSGMLVVNVVKDFAAQRQSRLQLVFCVLLQAVVVVIFLKYLHWSFFDYFSIVSFLLFYILLFVYGIDRLFKLQIFSERISRKYLVFGLICCVMLLPTLVRLKNGPNMLWHPSGSDRLFDVTDIRKDIVTVYEYDETKMFVDSARFYWEHGNEAMSGKYYQKAIQLEPRNAALRYHYSLELAHEDIEKAMSQLDTVVEIDTTFLAAYCNRGLYKYKLGRAADAIWEYDEGLKIRPGHPIILLNKALALESLGDKEGACRCLDAALNDQVSDYEGIKEQIDRTKDDMDCN